MSVMHAPPPLELDALLLEDELLVVVVVVAPLVDVVPVDPPDPLSSPHAMKASGATTVRAAKRGKRFVIIMHLVNTRPLRASVALGSMVR
jgi:hypothetical protein